DKLRRLTTGEGTLMELLIPNIQANNTSCRYAKTVFLSWTVLSAMTAYDVMFFRTLPHTCGKHRELFLIPVGRLNLILEDRVIVLGEINLYYTFSCRAFFGVLLVCHLLTPLHIHMAQESWKCIEDRLHCIVNGHYQLQFFQPVFNCYLLLSKHFNLDVRLLISLNSFFQFYAVFASCTTT
ncbi:hypothetical protein LSH36_101g03007, partial [Paralvinella palmiformis]